MAKEKIVLAYSGGLDTSVLLKWLQNEYNADVIAVYGNVGQTEDIDAIKKKAEKAGAKFYAADLRKEFVEDVIFKALKLNASYEDDYLLGTALARPIIAKALVEIAHKEKASAICHGATGKGNDQVRFEASIKALDPKLKIIAPWRIWDFKSREDLLEYAKANDIKLDQTKKKIYSRDENIWHISHEGGEFEDPWNEHEDRVHVLSKPVTKTPDTAKYITIGFNKGVPVSLDGKKIPSIKLLETLNKEGSKYGVGTIDIVETRLVGMKSRGIYETPGGTILYFAHKNLEKLVLDRESISEKNKLAIKYGELIYDGKYYTPLRIAIDAFADTLNEVVTGEVKVKLYKGHVLLAGTKSKNSLYDEAFATFGEDSVYDQKDASGFINLHSLTMKIRALKKLNKFDK